MSVRNLSHFILIALATALTACQPSLTPMPRPTPAILEVGFSPALKPLASSFNTCAAQNALGLVLIEQPDATLEGDHATLNLRWGPPEKIQGYAAVIGYEELVVVVNPQNSLQSLNLDQVQGIFQGTIQDWSKVATESAAKEIHPWTYPDGEDVQQVFERKLLGEPVPEGKTYLAPDPAAMREGVAKDPNALGYLPKHWVNESVKGVAVDGLESEQPGEAVLALSASEPEGSGRDWLLCLQEQLGAEP